jgi:hypothetical protein
MQVPELLEEMITQQEAKLFLLAQRLRANVTADDMLNPHDIPELSGNVHFNYEEGFLAALKSFRMAWLSEEKI